MSERKFSYKSDSIEITYEPKLCIHAAECANGLPAVFNPENKPWVNPDADSADNIVKVIERCPTGAVKYERLDEGHQEQASMEPKVITVPNGPLYISGDIYIQNNSGELVSNETRIALCRCGDSKNKPFCDNTHLEAKFNAE